MTKMVGGLASAFLVLAAAAANVVASAPKLDKSGEPAHAYRPQRRRFGGGPVDLRREIAHRKIDHDRGDVVTIPHWSDSFERLGLTYRYTMVGTDPRRGSATTRIPTILIPLRFVFDSGLVIDASADSIDGRTSIQGILESPIFRPIDFTAGNVAVGRTQYGDAFQRANFWREVSGRSRDYHVLLDPPTVAAPFEVHVPDTAVFFATDPETNTPLTLMDDRILFQATSDALRQASMSPAMLPIVVWGDVLGWAGTVGYHAAEPVPGGVQTFIGVGYHPRSLAFGQDVYGLSHEVLEWMDDPFEDNFTPGWNPPGYVYPHCVSRFAADRLEVADVLEFLPDSGVPVSTGPTTYHLADAAFLDFFRRVAPSGSANGQYTFFGLTPSPSSECTGHVQVDTEEFEFPGATATSAFGINNRGVIVGDFTDQPNTHHGFVFDGRKVSQIDYPGAASTFLYKVNDAGQAVGAYRDADGTYHGFSYWRAEFRSLSVPDSIDGTSLANGINSRGDIVGEFDLFLPITRAFSYMDGQYRSIGTPFGGQTEARDINDQGLIVGDAYDDGPAHGFLFDGASFTRFDFPGAEDTIPFTVNNQGMHGGFFSDPAVGGIGYVTIGGNPYEVYADVRGMNDQGNIVGYTIDTSGCEPFTFCPSARRVGYVATLPKAHADSVGGR